MPSCWSRTPSFSSEVNLAISASSKRRSKTFGADLFRTLGKFIEVSQSIEPLLVERTAVVPGIC